MRGAGALLSKGERLLIPLRPSNSLRLQPAEQSIRFAINSRGKEEGVGWGGRIAKGDHPQAVNRQNGAILVEKLTHKGSGHGVKGANASVPEIAYQQIVAETSEICWCQS